MVSQPLLAALARKRRKISTKPVKNRTLVVTYEAIGDMLMTLPLFPALKQARPDWQLEVLAHPRNAQVLVDHPAIDKVWNININSKPLRDRKQSEIRKNLNQQNFTQVLYLGERLSTVTLLRLQKLKTKRLLSLPFIEGYIEKKGTYRIGMLDGFIGKNKEEEPHFTKRMLSVLPDLGIELPQHPDFSPHFNFEIEPGDIKENHLLFNPCGTQQGNTLSDINACKLAEDLSAAGYNVHIFDLHENRQKLSACRVFSDLAFIPSNNIKTAAKIISQMALVVTTDTAIGHLGCAMQRPTIIMREDDSWRATCDPLSTDAHIVISPSANDINQITSDQLMTKIRQVIGNR